jgi:hypothetical protein
MTNEVTTRQEGAVALDADALALMEGAAPTKDFNKDDLLIPRVQIVQATSGYVARNDPEFIAEARPGDIIDTLTKTTHQQIAFIPVKYSMEYSEWKPNRGGLVKNHGADATLYNASEGGFGSRVTESGNEVVPSATYWGLVLFPDGATMPAIIGMSGTQFRKSRRLNTLIEMLELTKTDGSRFTPPMFSRAYHFTTVSESNDQGSWYGWSIAPGPMVLSQPGGKVLFERAIKLREQIESGAARAAPEATTRDPATGGPARGADDIPF